MYAIVEIAGQQFKVEKEQEIFVHRLEGDEGASIEFDNVLFFDNDGKIDIGNPVVDGVLVKGKIIEHMKGDKVIVFHKKRRKGYQKENGHRQYLSKVLIEDILTGAKKSAKKEEPKAEAKKEATPKAEAKKEEPKAEVKKEEPKKEKTEAKAEAKKEEAKATETKAETKKEEPKAEAKTEEKKEVKAATPSKEDDAKEVKAGKKDKEDDNK